MTALAHTGATCTGRGARVKTRGYSSTSEYMRELVRRDEERAAEERFVALIHEGLNSPIGRPWEEHRAELRARIEAARAAQSKPT